MEENSKEKQEEKVIKCASCGANLNSDRKKCEYCGSVNPNYKPKEITLNKQSLSKKNIFGGIFGNVFEDILDKFGEE